MFTRVLFLLLCVFLGAEQTRATPFCTFFPLAEGLRLLQEPNASVSAIAAKYGASAEQFSQCILVQFQRMTQEASLLDFANAFAATPGVLDAAGDPAEVGAKVLDKVRTVRKQETIRLYVRVLDRFLPHLNDIGQTGYAELFMRVTALNHMTAEQRKSHFIKAIEFFTNRRVTLTDLVSLAVLSLASSSTQEERLGFLTWLYNKERIETINTEDLTGKVLPSAMMVQQWNVVDMILFVLRARQVEIPAVLSACRIGTNSLVEYAILQDTPAMLEALLLRGMPSDGVRNLLDTASFSKITATMGNFQVGEETGYCRETQWRYHGQCYVCDHPNKRIEDVPMRAECPGYGAIRHTRPVYCLYGKFCPHSHHYSDLVIDRPQNSCPHAKTRPPVVGVNDLPRYRELAASKLEIATLFARYDAFVKALDACAQISRSSCDVVEIYQEVEASDADAYFKTKPSSSQPAETKKQKKQKKQTCVLM